METHYCPRCGAAVAADRSSCVGCALDRPAVGWPLDPYAGLELDAKYRVDRRVGAGGMGAVYLGRHIHEGHDLGQVVLKFLHHEHCANERTRKRFLSEARAARAVASPHAVKVYDVGLAGEVPYVVMERLEGRSLADHLAGGEGRLELRAALRVALQVADAMADCHRKGVLHRDLKPDNVLLLEGPELFAKIIDFGIARVDLGDGTTTHAPLGTPRYMSPEQIRGEEVDGRTDIFALGVMLFEMIAGEPPSVPAGGGGASDLKLNVNAAPRALGSLVPDVPSVLDELVGRMLARERDARPADMEEVARALRVILGEGRERPATWIPSERVSTAPRLAAETLPRATGEITPDHGTPGARRRGLWRVVGIGAVLVAATAWGVCAGTTSMPSEIPGPGAGTERPSVDVGALGAPASPVSGTTAAAGIAATASVGTTTAAGTADATRGTGEDIAAREDTVRIRVETRPPGAEVSVDGAPWPERTPCTIELSRGGEPVMLRAVKEGHRAATRSVAPSADKTVKLVLKPEAVIRIRDQ